MTHHPPTFVTCPSANPGMTKSIAMPGDDSPISLLPPEILAEIFEYCLVIDSFTAPVRLSHVSSLWRQTAISTPRLWCKIDVTLSSSSSEIMASRVCSWLERSGMVPIEIVLRVHHWQGMDGSQIKVLNTLRDHGHHWSRFSLVASSHEVARDACFYLTAHRHHEMLSRMDIWAGYSTDGLDVLSHGDDNPERDITAVFQAVTGTHAPRFRELNLTTSAIPLPGSSIPTEQLELSRLRILRIYERYSMTTEIRPLHLLYLLDKCPALEYFLFRGATLSSATHTLMMNVVNLPHLRQLHLINTSHQHTLLSHLCTPIIETLRLSWLNHAEFFPGDVVHESSPSDEMDDDPVEFSQSPQTDLLTGLGLRSLVRNTGTLPIRVLDMDFSDMRSPKDFIWVFKHLPLLESFRIVGSDMSDTVLYALASPGRDGRWLCPLLTNLELSRCDVITGNGVLALSEGRNNGNTLHGPRRLKQFTVGFCARVDCESIALMQNMLGIVNLETACAIPLYVDSDANMMRYPP